MSTFPYDPTIFTADPRVLLTPWTCPHTKSRAQVEHMIIRCCAINPVALRLVRGLYFGQRHLKDPKLRWVWKWLATPEALREPLPQAVFDQMKRNIHDGAGCLDHKQQFRDEVMLAVAGALWLIMQRAGDREQRRELRKMLINAPPDVTADLCGMMLKYNAEAAQRNLEQSHE